MENNIKIIRLQSGEDIMASYTEDGENGTILLDNPMHIIFKRIPTGQTVMMMMPWLPIEIIKENSAIVYDSDILTIVEPKEDLIEYYANVVIQAQERMEQEVPFHNFDDDDDEDGDGEEIEDMDVEELLDLMKEKKKNRLH